MTASLVGEEGSLKGLVIPLEGESEWIIGRDVDVCFQVLEDPMVSRKHVMIRKQSDEFILENLSATNPANVNGQPVLEPTQLSENDHVQIGSTTFLFSLQPQPTPPAPPEPPTSPIEEPDKVQEPDSLLSFARDHDARWLLKVVAGPNSGAEYALTENAVYVLGKDAGTCDVIFQDMSVSRQHAQITLKDEETVMIEDLNSRNGVLVNGSLIEKSAVLTSQDLVAIGTTSFLIIDQKINQETIVSPKITSPKPVVDESDGTKTEGTSKDRKAKETIIPTKHLIIAGVALFGVIYGFYSMASLFKSQPVEIVKEHSSKKLKEALAHFPGVEYNFDPKSGKLLIMGHVLTEGDYQELQYLLHSLPFIKSKEDSVVVDELVWQNMNALLSKNPVYRSVAMTGFKPGRFVIRGYLQTPKELADLNDFMDKNFSYLNKLENQVVVDSILEARIKGLLEKNGFAHVSLQLTNGEAVLSGRANAKDQSRFKDTTQSIATLNGVRTVKDIVVFATINSSRIDLSERFQITGISKKSGVSEFVLINGKILSKGDMLDGMKITRIDGNTVLLEKGHNKYKIDYNF